MLVSLTSAQHIINIWYWIMTIYSIRYRSKFAGVTITISSLFGVHDFAQLKIYLFLFARLNICCMDNTLSLIASTGMHYQNATNYA